MGLEFRTALDLKNIHNLRCLTEHGLFFHYMGGKQQKKKFAKVWNVSICHYKINTYVLLFSIGSFSASYVTGTADFYFSFKKKKLIISIQDFFQKTWRE